MMQACDDPFVIQIGANDGNDRFRRHVERYRPRGILVEPQRDAFDVLRQSYANQPQIRLANVAIAESAGPRPLYRSDRARIGAFPTSGLASLVPEKNGLAREGAQRLRTETVSCITFSELVANFDVRHVTYLQIDTEGYDFEILRSIDFDRLKPDMLRYEYVNLNADEQAACRALLRDAGYRMLTLAIDVFAYRRALPGSPR
jgi:FkbM family methyltransferase